MAVKASTLHTPTHLAWASGEPFNFGGLTAEHLGWTVEKMLARGALVIGEAGPGIDAHWVDYALVPEAVRRFGGEVDTAAARALLGATERGEAEKVAALLRQAGVPEPDPAAFLGVVESIHEWSRLAGESLAEAVTSAERCGVPLVFHHTPGTYELLVEATERLGPNLIAAHSNFQATGPDEAVRRARAIKNLGGVVDIMSGDCFGSREFFDTPDVSFAMLAAGVVDLISTDYGGGFWDSMLVLIEEAALSRRHYAGRRGALGHIRAGSSDCRLGARSRSCCAGNGRRPRDHRAGCALAHPSGAHRGAPRRTPTRRVGVAQSSR